MKNWPVEAPGHKLLSNGAEGMAAFPGLRRLVAAALFLDCQVSHAVSLLRTELCGLLDSLFVRGLVFF